MVDFIIARVREVLSTDCGDFSYCHQNSTTKENEVLLAIGTAYVQGEDVAGRGRVLLYSLGKNTENPQNLVIILAFR